MEHYCRNPEGLIPSIFWRPFNELRMQLTTEQHNLQTRSPSNALIQKMLFKRVEQRSVDLAIVHYLAHGERRLLKRNNELG